MTVTVLSAEAEQAALANLFATVHLDEPVEGIPDDPDPDEDD